MLYRLVITVLLFLYISFTYSYTRLGVTGGPTLAGLTGDVIAQNYFNNANHLEFNDNALGFDAGISLTLGSESIQLITDCVYRYTGTYFSVIQSLYSNTPVENGFLDLSYLYLPITLRAKSSFGAYIEFGAYYSALLFFQSYIIDDENSLVLSADYAINDDLITPYDYGYILGLGFDTTFFTLGSRLTYSLNDFFQNEYKEQEMFTTLFNVSLLISLMF